MRGYSHLSDDEREQIGLLKVLGHSIGAIARAIRRPKSTISRELSRNRLPSGRYSPLHAAGAYQLRRRREALIEKDRALRTFVLDRLAEGWTPEQIAGWLKAGNERRLRAVGCETIYAFIYRAAQKAEQLWRYLTRRHKRRRPRRSRPSRDTIKDRVSIHERPENIDARTEAGHWEGDLIICKRTRPVLVLHERKSRVTLAARLVGKTAAETISVMLAVFARIEPALRKSITFDNDTTFAQHARLKSMCAMTTWFCDAYASWQKGGVRKRQWPIATLVAASDRHRQSVRRRNPGHHPHRQSIPGDPQRAWQRRANPVFIDPLHLAPESDEGRSSIFLFDQTGHHLLVPTKL